MQILLPDLPGAGVWQIATGSYNSIVNLNSCIDYIKAACGRAHMMPLTLERREQEIQHDGKKTKHYILHINMDFKLSDLQKWALIEPTRILLDLPDPDTAKEDLLFEENAVLDVEAASQDAPGSTNAAGQPKPQPESVDEQAIIDSLKKSLSVMMKGFTAPQKKAFFDYVITGDVTVDKLQHFLDNYEKFKEMFTKLQAA